MPSPLDPGKFVEMQRGGKAYRLERVSEDSVDAVDDDGNTYQIARARIDFKKGGQLAFSTNRPADEVQDILDRMEADGWTESATGNV